MRRVAGWLAAGVLLAGANQGLSGEGLDPTRLTTSTRYDREYAPIAYSEGATHNRVWQLQQRLASGELKLDWEPQHGYLRSLLKALDIHEDSQVLVFSSTSLQFSAIDPTNPRGIFFNEDTYIGYVPGSPFMELAAIDAEKGLVFHGFDNTRERPLQVMREGGRCLTCHDTYSMTGGGVPRVVVMSAPVQLPADDRQWSAAMETDDRTPVSQRWGGWYVTGSTGRVQHFGNQPLREQKRDARLRELSHQHNVSSLKDYFDTSRQLNDHSDVVALLVLEHQAYVQNLITRIGYKVHTVMQGEQATRLPQRWSDVSATNRKRVQPMMDALVRALFLQDAAPFEDRIQGSSGFTARFEQAGPADARGRSLRQLDLQTRLFRYPLSFLVYSEQFDAMPPFALDYVQGRIAEVLSGRGADGIGAHLSAADREAIREILRETKPSMAARLSPG